MTFELCLQQGQDIQHVSLVLIVTLENLARPFCHSLLLIAKATCTITAVNLEIPHVALKAKTQHGWSVELGN